jgi:hypothetical protein
MTAEPLAGAKVNLLTRLDDHCVGRFAEIVPLRRMESVTEHRSSDPGPASAPNLQIQDDAEWIGLDEGLARPSAERGARPEVTAPKETASTVLSG